MKGEIAKIFKQILRDIKVELGDEFARNFERQAFFSDKWQRSRRAERRGGATLIDSGKLRRSITSKSDGTSITFYSSLPYAAIHNEGGEIKVTARMKRYFRYRFYQAQGGFNRGNYGTQRKTLSDGGFYAWTSKMSLTDEAEMWRYMALMKVGSSIKIPRRRFLGASPEVESAVREIIEENLTTYFGSSLAHKIQESIRD